MFGPNLKETIKAVRKTVRFALAPIKKNQDVLEAKIDKLQETLDVAIGKTAQPQTPQSPSDHAKMERLRRIQRQMDGQVGNVVADHSVLPQGN